MAAVAPMGLPTSVEPGNLVGAYLVLKRLGSGGMGDVFLAEHTRFQDRVAIKVLRPEYLNDKRAHGRFVREARLARRVRHEHIAETADLDYLSDGRPYLMMEHVEGEEVYALWTESGMSLDRFLDVMTQIADALATAHQAGVVHRDLKPSNVFIAERGGRPDQVKILDFGLAKLIHASDEKLTQTGQVVATPTYMSPEQATGEPVDGRSDIYSFGVLMWELLVGRRPFNGNSFGDYVLLHATVKPEAPSLAGETKVDGAIPPELDALVLRCLAKRPQDRFGTAEELLQALTTIHHAYRFASAPPTSAAGLRRWVTTRHARLLAAGVAVGALLIGLMVHALRPAPAPVAVAPRVDVAPLAEVAPAARPPDEAPRPSPSPIGDRKGDVGTIEPLVIALPPSRPVPFTSLPAPRKTAVAAPVKRRPVVPAADADGLPSATLIKDPFGGHP